jgi:hypothetical protein
MDKQNLINIYNEAKAQNSWESLKPYPVLLFVWQQHHKQDSIPIAMWVSHYRSRRHKWCIPNCEAVGFTEQQVERYVNSLGEVMPF